MKAVFFSARSYEKPFLDESNRGRGHEITFLEARLTPDTAALAQGYPVVSAFVVDDLRRPTLEILKNGGTRLIALRSAGFNHVDLAAARELGLKVVRVPAYSPHAVAEHTLALILALNRRIPRAYNRVREGNFNLEGLMGFDLAGKTAGVVGTGRIGAIAARILKAFGCRVLAFDPNQDSALVADGIKYVSLEDLCRESDIVTLHCPLTPKTHHLIGAQTLELMKPGVMIVNTSRGGLADSRALIEGLKSGRIGYLGLDVYEEEDGLFFRDFSGKIIQDDVFSRLLTFPNVVITGHQGFFTQEALSNIASTTLESLTQFENRSALAYEISDAG